jgi:hypothetical protein
VCPIRNTPHYSFAREIIEKALKGEFSPLPEKSSYEEYCLWEAYCVEGNMGHSPRNYYRKLAHWVKNFNIQANIPEVMAFGNGQYYIFDGVHRIVLMAFLIDLGLLADKVPVEIIEKEEPALPVLGISNMEVWLNFK